MAALALPCVLRGVAALPGHVPGDTLATGPRSAAVQLALADAVRERGLAGWLADDAHGFPARTDRVALHGVPVHGLLDAALAPLGPTHAPWAASLAVAMLGSLGAWALGRRGGNVPALLAAAAWCTGAAWLHATRLGDSAALFGMALLPWVAVAARAGKPVLAGGGAGLAVLAMPELAPVAGLAWWAGGRERTPEPGTARARGTPLTPLAAALAPLAFPLAWWAAARATPAAPLLPWATTLAGGLPVRPVDLEATASLGGNGVVLHTLARPALLATAVWAVLRARAAGEPGPRGAAILAGAGLLFALGPVWQAPGVGQVVLPWGLMQLLPGLEGRDAPWVCAAAVPLAAALLLGRATSPAGWRSALLAGALVGEAVAASPALPAPSLDLHADASDAALPRGTGPLLTLPLPGGAIRRDRGDLLAQRVHGRPLVAPLVGVDGPWTSHGERSAWRDNAALAGILACEEGRAPATTDPATIAGALAGAGVGEILFDPRVPGAERALACTATLLQGWRRGSEPPWVWWRPPG